MSPQAIEQDRNTQLDNIIRLMYRNLSIDLNTVHAATDWVNMTQAEVVREKKNALPARRTLGLRSRLRHLVTLILAH